MRARLDYLEDPLAFANEILVEILRGSDPSDRTRETTCGEDKLLSIAALAGAGAAMMDSFLSILPKGLFGLNPGMEEMTASEASLASSLMLVDDSGRKRSRVLSASGSRTPTLVRSAESDTEVEDDVRPVKRFRGERNVIPISPLAQSRKKPEPESPFSMLHEDAVSHCLSFLSSVEDRFALQCTSKQFRRISNSNEMLAKIQVGGDRKTGLHGIIQEHDTPETAAKNLAPYVEAENLEAMYM